MCVGVLIRLLLLTLVFKEYKLVLMRIFKFKYTEQMIFVFFFREQWLSQTSYFLDPKLFSKSKCWLFGALMCSKVLSNKNFFCSILPSFRPKKVLKESNEKMFETVSETRLKVNHPYYEKCIICGSAVLVFIIWFIPTSCFNIMS